MSAWWLVPVLALCVCVVLSVGYWLEKKAGWREVTVCDVLVTPTLGRKTAAFLFIEEDKEGRQRAYVQLPDRSYPVDIGYARRLMHTNVTTRPCSP